MTGAEAGFLLLTSRLGDPDRKVLTPAQLRILSSRVQTATKADEGRQLNVEDLVKLGYGREMAERILLLLSEEERLHHYCRKAEKLGCVVLTRVTGNYPQRLWRKLGEETPGCIWCRGDMSLLTQPKVALVGSRDILGQNRDFAAEVGRQAALQGYVLVSGNARGADQIAQSACLRAGGKVISVVADCLAEKQIADNILYLSEDEFDSPFTAQRAISRNRLIHCLAELTFVAQCGYKEGGTWNGTAKNLRHGWSDVFCYADGSPIMELLQQLGAEIIETAQLYDFEQLPRKNAGFLDDF